MCGNELECLANQIVNEALILEAMTSWLFVFDFYRFLVSKFIACSSEGLAMTTA